MSYTRWNIPRGGTAVPKALLDAGCTPLLAAVLYARGCATAEQARQFLSCGGALLGDPLLLPDLETAAERLRRAIAAREHVAVYGDYDVDGITSSCMVADYLRSRGVPCELYIPDRMDEGYGVNASAIETLHTRGVSLIVTVDCGVTTVEETAYANSLGMEMIITDHHECRETLPPAVAVVDPKRPDCAYPNRDLAGVGVAFKLLCALDGDAERVLSRYADLVAVGTVADVMPLVGENRYIVRRGLEKLERNPRPGLRALMGEAGLDGKKPSSTGIGFVLAPRLNASGRLGQVGLATALLLTEDPGEAAENAAALCRLNRERQSLESEIWTQAQTMLDGEAPEGPIVLASEGWHQGVVGIVASRLTEAYNMPAVMICLEDGRGKGSCRSCGSFNLFEALSACAEHLEGFGGHALAAGLTVRSENIPAFRAALTAYYRAHPPLSAPALEIELCADSPELLRMDCVEDLDRLEPCGAGNPRALLVLQGAVLSELTPIGGGKHLRVRLEKFGQSYEGVFFSHRLEEFSGLLRPGDRVDAAFYPQINDYRGRRSTQLLLVGLRPHDDSAARTILRGGLGPADVPDTPDRADCALVWRALSARGGHSAGAPAELAEHLAPSLREEKVCIILKIFEELGLLTLRPEGNVWYAAAVPGAGKVALDSSEILKRLRG
ncbi:MAG: single-stranded-DNA-specific exonuclease RecJ [Oscillospiraceae bacterium]|nr:single-stranded-DNA-specific exonuclease RecJ [Oscillospiraceae bacterium]